MNELGELRPSQLIYTFGVGGLVDLPHVSALIMGLDDWDTRYCSEIVEDRLLQAVRRTLGQQVDKLYLPPMQFDEKKADPTAPAIGVPVSPFPRWLRCPLCDTLATMDSGIFNLVQDPYRPDRTRFVHVGCAKANTPPDAFTVRFLLACREGHLSDFPWIDYVHNGRASCVPSRLTLREYGAAGDASDIILKCLECNAERRMADAFDKDKFSIRCRGHHPHLRYTEQNGCNENASVILLGASNSWFPVVMSALSLPTSASDKISRIIEDHWADLKDIPSLDVARFVTAPSRMPFLSEFDANAIWAAIEAVRASKAGTGTEIRDLKSEEWSVISSVPSAPQTKHFKSTRVPAPVGYSSVFEETILLEKLREVRVLTGFTRVESKGDFTDATYTDDGRRTPLSRQPPKWLPASEVRGEGIFIRIREDALAAWESRDDVQKLESAFLASHKAWRRMRRQTPPEAGFPGIRFVLLHSLSHALMRQITLECGYTSASVRERIYSQKPEGTATPMAGILIYTAASDSEGTLGGLVQLGNPLNLGRQIEAALEGLRICGSDPLCSEHAPSPDGRSVHGACCHACLFSPETSCERGNRFLDRTTLVETFASKAVEFFSPE
jgi:hypothetical protein